ncbi:MAG TPA: phage virion morphogenesis protein, partial [Gemmata sp.]
MAGLVITFADLARFARQQSGPLAPPLKASGPLDPLTGRELAQIATSDVKRRFATGTAPDGTRWKPLRYARANGGNQPLRDTGALMASITGRATATEVIVGTNHPGAALHNFGGTVVPRR